MSKDNLLKLGEEILKTIQEKIGGNLKNVRTKGIYQILELYNSSYSIKFREWGKRGKYYLILYEKDKYRFEFNLEYIKKIQNSIILKSWPSNPISKKIIKKLFQENKIKKFNNFEGLKNFVVEMFIEVYKNHLNKLNFKNLIFYGPPGTGKTYNTIIEAVKIIEDLPDCKFEYAKEKFNEYMQKGQIEFITFHQNYSYEDFIQGIKPDISDSQNGLTFKKVDGIFMKICINAFFEYIKQIDVKNLKNDCIKEYLNGKNLKEIRTYEEKREIIQILLKNCSIEDIKKETEDFEVDNYIIIIDEINRANISRVFGELITLIEEDKRSHGDIPFVATLSSGDKFVVPSNLYIIGTMNTADKSIALLDVALRRRFTFKGYYPDYELIEDNDKRKVLEKINERIIDEKGIDFQIGHSYFMEVGDLVDVMNNKVIPLLYEYFMNDSKKVQDILEKTLEAAETDKVYDVDTDSIPLRIKEKQQ